jgi:hypothetical protein
MLLYLDGTVVPMKVVMDIQWMVRWRVLVEFGHRVIMEINGYYA